jgi:type I restriction enzyme S subunit
VSVRPYPAYKDSGVERIGDIPCAWEVRRVSQVATLVNGFPFNSDLFDPEEGLPLLRIRDLNCSTAEVRYRGEIVENALITGEDVLIDMDGDFNVGRWKGKGPALLNQRLCCLRGEADFVRLLEYALPHPLKLINDVTYSTTVKHLSSGQVRNLRVAVPSSGADVGSLVAFLDRETAKIDALVAEQERLMALLKEKRQAVISQAVTKGLNPHAPMKPSGVEWLGEVPAAWTAIPVRRVATRIQAGATPPTAQQQYFEEGTVPWYGPSSFDGEIVVGEPVKFLNVSAIQDGVARLFAASCTLIVAIGATLGKVSSLVAAGSTNQQITAIEFDQNRVFARFGTYQMKRLEQRLRAVAPSATLPILAADDIADIALALPTVGEQNDISDFLDAETAKLDTLVTEATHAITLLKERRSALISAAVTGKIDVRAAVGAELVPA